MAKVKIYNHVLENPNATHFFCYFIIGCKNYKEVKKKYLSVNFLEHNDYNKNKIIYSLSGKDIILNELEKEKYLFLIVKKDYKINKKIIVSNILDRLDLKNDFNQDIDSIQKSLITHFFELSKDYNYKYDLFKKEIKNNENLEIIFNLFKNYIEHYIENYSSYIKYNFPNYFTLIKSFINGISLSNQLSKFEKQYNLKRSNNLKKSNNQLIDDLIELCELYSYLNNWDIPTLISKEAIEDYISFNNNGLLMKEQELKNKELKLIEKEKKLNYENKIIKK